MYLVLGIIGFIISLCMLIVYSLRIKREKKKYLGIDVLQNIADKNVKAAKKHDVMITCDYCGAKIDTRIHRVCPQCGGAYGKDQEWKERHEIDVNKAQQGAEKDYKKQKKKYEDNTAYERSRIKTILIRCILVIVAVVSCIVIACDCTRNNDLASEKLPSGYIEENYSFQTSQLLDDEGINVKLGKIYKKDNGKNSHYLIELIATNNRNKVASLSLDVCSVNMIAETEFMHDKLIVNNGTPVTRYIKLSYVTYPEIKNIQFSGLIVSEEDTMTPITGIPKPFSLETDSKFEPKTPKLNGDLLYENQNVKITLNKAKEKKALLYIQNIGDEPFKLDAKGVIDGEEAYVSLYDTLLPGVTGVYWTSDIYMTSDIQKLSNYAEIRIIGKDTYMDPIFDTGYMKWYPDIVPKPTEKEENATIEMKETERN